MVVTKDSAEKASFMRIKAKPRLISTYRTSKNKAKATAFAVAFAGKGFMTTVTNPFFDNQEA